MTHETPGTVKAELQPVIVVSQLAYEKISAWVDLCSVEISGLAKGEVFRGPKTGRLHFKVDDVELFRQWGTGGGTEIDPLELAEWQEKIGAMGVMPDVDIFWWHSHVNMGVFWSGTDEECIRSLVNKGVLASIVFNKRREWKARVDTLIGPKNVQWTQEAVMHVEQASYNVREECDKVMKEKMQYGVRPKRDLTDDRLAAIQKAEDEAKKSNRGTVYTPNEKGGYVHIGGRGGEGWKPNDPADRSHWSSGQWTRCEQCPAMEYCASPVIYSQQIGCHGRSNFIGFDELRAEHWRKAHDLKRTALLQSWRDRRAAANKASSGWVDSGKTKSAEEQVVEQNTVKEEPVSRVGNTIKSDGKTCVAVTASGEVVRKMCMEARCTTWITPETGTRYWALGVCPEHLTDETENIYEMLADGIFSGMMS